MNAHSKPQNEIVETIDGVSMVTHKNLYPMVLPVNLTDREAIRVATEAQIEGEKEYLAQTEEISPAVVAPDLKTFANTHQGNALQEIDAEENKIDHLRSATKVIDFFGAKNLITTSQGLWKYNGHGVWHQINERVIKAIIQKIIKPSHKLTKSVVSSITDMVLTETFRPDHQFDPDKDIISINVQNGEVEWTGEVWVLKPHCRERYHTTQLPIRYSSEAKAPRFTQFLKEVFEQDSDQADKAVLVCEAIGYSLLRTCQYEKFFLLIGGGANGKSVLMSILAELIGPEHVAGVQPSQLDNRFQRGHLYGKLVNIVTEIAEGHEIQDAQLKAITSGELTTAEHKHAHPFEFRPFSTCWFGTNHMPHTRDFSDALFRRAIIITLNRKFEEHEQDRQLVNKLKTELPGILNAALDAMAGVLRTGEFTRCVSSEEAKKEWRLECDQGAQFVEDACITGVDLKITSNQLYKAYLEWANSAGIRKTLNRKNFTQRLVRLGMENYRGTRGTRMLAGISLPETNLEAVR